MIKKIMKYTQELESALFEMAKNNHFLADLSTIKEKEIASLYIECFSKEKDIHGIIDSCFENLADFFYTIMGLSKYMLSTAGSVDAGRMINYKEILIAIKSCDYLWDKLIDYVMCNFQDEINGLIQIIIEEIKRDES